MNALIDHRPTPQATQEYYTVANTIQTKSLDPLARCCYPSKRCENPRVVKRNGELHRFCEYHRAKANTNQRQLERRRRVEQMVEQLPIEEYMQHLNEQYELLVQQENTKYEELPPSDLLMRLDLDEDDLRVLAEVLCVEEKEDGSDQVHV
ncbi:hypothetical protein Gpo141_00003501 [Globisporangium polare]